MRFFVNNLTGYVESAVVQTLLAQEEEVIGTFRAGTIPPKGVSQAVEASRVADARALLRSADAIVYSLFGQLDETRAAIRALRKGFEGEKLFIAVSSVMTWANTQPVRETKANEDEEEEKGGDGDEEEEFAGFKEDDYRRRRPHTAFLDFHTVEALVLSAATEQLQTYVLGAGIMYGRGETTFRDFFKAAWLCEDLAVPDLGGRGGANVVPTVHVTDLAGMVYATATTPPEPRYFFAVDRSSAPLRSLLGAVSKRLSWGRLRDLTAEETDDWCLEDEQRAALLSVDLKLDREGSVLESDLLDVDWVAKEGLAAASRRVVREYVDTFNLRPQRIVVLGPPGAGKTTLARRLAAKYHLPLVDAGAALREAVEDDESKLGIKARGEMASAKDKRVGEATMGLVVRAKLFQPPCQNQGFVLDGFPRTWAEARAAFHKGKGGGEEEEEEEADAEGAEGEEGEEEGPVTEVEEEEEGEEPACDRRLLPRSIVVVHADEDTLLARVLAMPEEETKGTHSTKDGFKRRYKTYADRNRPDAARTAVAWLEQAVRLEHLPVEARADRPVEDVEAAAVEYVERAGKPYNFHPTPQELAEQRAAREAAEAEAKRAAEDEEKREDDEEAGGREEREAEAFDRLAEIGAEEDRLLEERTKPLRQYLMTAVVPTITQGLLEVCRAKPDDPVDYLAEWLFAHNPVETGEPDDDEF